jgi:hypothetical protein
MDRYHLRFLKTDDTARTIESADIVRVQLQDVDGASFGVQLHAQPTPPPLSNEVVLRLTRQPGESEADFVKRAFQEAADRRRQQLG